MIVLLGAVAVVLYLFLILTAYLQHLYLESLRLLVRESAALTYFKEELEDRLGLKGDQGALTFSVLKHSTLALLTLVILSLVQVQGPPFWQTFTETFVLSWVALITGSYLIPQALYKRTSGHWILPVLPALKLVTIVTRPLISVLTFFQTLVEIGNGKEHPEEEANSAEHIDALITAGTEEGIIEEEDRKLIQSVMSFGDKQVREVMTPRPNIIAIPSDKSLEQLRQLVVHEQYSRIPVYEGDIDHIIGFVHVRDMFEVDPDTRESHTVRELLRPIRPVPETKAVDDLLREMQRDGTHMVVVVDEYGNTAGIVTMEDLVEEIFGEIRDEHEPARDITVEDSGAYVVSGSFDLDHLSDLVEFRPEAETESTTVGGLVSEWLGRVPAPGEVVERDGIRIEVLAGNELRVEQVRISRIPKETATKDGYNT
ncbi:MAG: HlyC/CorC family transporter [Bryobacteraceae bacterium]|nr:HlyC/CorC family transporter [Bryobacteraceae bacterium]